MKLTNISTRYPPTVSNGIIDCFVNEPFKILTGRTYTADIGFGIEHIPRIKMVGWRTDDIFIHSVELPFVGIMNFGDDKVFEKGEFLCHIGCFLLFSVILDRF
jgi:hypothetical protein